MGVIWNFLASFEQAFEDIMSDDGQKDALVGFPGWGVEVACVRSVAWVGPEEYIALDRLTVDEDGVWRPVENVPHYVVSFQGVPAGDQAYLILEKDCLCDGFVGLYRGPGGIRRSWDNDLGAHCCRKE